MKHPSTTVVTLLILFLCAQFVGLFIIQAYQTNEALLPIEPPEVENKTFSFIPLIIAILIGTLLVLTLAKFGLFKIWKLWYAVSIFVALFYALTPFAVTVGGNAYPVFLLLVVVLLVALKLQWTNVIYQNVIEMFIYGGIVALFIPLVNIPAVIILLILMSIYDVYAVRSSKHMVKLAEFQLEQNSFAGINLSSNKVKQSNKSNLQAPRKVSKKQTAAAILGGGDIAFPLLLSGALLQSGWPLMYALAVSVGAAAGLLILFKLSQQGKYYPALPFVSGGAGIIAILIYLVSSIV